MATARNVGAFHDHNIKNWLLKYFKLQFSPTPWGTAPLTPNIVTNVGESSSPGKVPRGAIE